VLFIVILHNGVNITFVLAYNISIDVCYFTVGILIVFKWYEWSATI